MSGPSESNFADIKKFLRDQLPAFFFASLGSFVTVLIVLWDGIYIKFISSGLIPYDVSSDVNEYFFAFLGRGTVDTIGTYIFWVLVGVIGVFILWVLLNTYVAVSNALIIYSQYQKKSTTFAMDLTRLMGEKVLVGSLTIAVVLGVTKIVVPVVLDYIGVHLLLPGISLADVAYIIAGTIVIALAYLLTWNIIYYSIKFLRFARE